MELSSVVRAALALSLALPPSGIGAAPLSGTTGARPGTTSPASEARGLAPFGRVVAVYPARGPARGTVVFLQDVHRNPLAQRNISGALTALSAAGALDVLALEGASGPLDFRRFQIFPDQDLIRQTADHLLSHDRISGAAHAAFTAGRRSFPVLGIEDPALYAAHVAAYRRAAAGPPVDWAAARRALDRDLRAAPEVAALAADARDHRRGRLSLESFLARWAGDGLAGEGFPEIRRFLSVSKGAAALDARRLERERRSLASAVAGAFPDLSARAAAGEFSAGTGGLALLCRRAGLDPSRFPELMKREALAARSAALDLDRLNREVAGWERTELFRRAKTPAGRSLALRVRWLTLLEGLAAFRLTPAEWEELEPVFPAARRDFGLSPGGLAGAADFYRWAARRDDALAARFLRAVRSAGARRSALVAGGHHAPGVTRRLLQAGWTVVLFVPRVGPGGGNALREFTRPPTPLEEMLKGALAPPPTSPAAMVEAVLDAAARRESEDPRTDAPDPEVTGPLSPPDLPVSTNLRDAPGGVAGEAAVGGTRFAVRWSQSGGIAVATALPRISLEGMRAAARWAAAEADRAAALFRAPGAWAGERLWALEDLWARRAEIRAYAIFENDIRLAMSRGRFLSPAGRFNASVVKPFFSYLTSSVNLGLSKALLAVVSGLTEGGWTVSEGVQLRKHAFDLARENSLSVADRTRLGRLLDMVLEEPVYDLNDPDLRLAPVVREADRRVSLATWAIGKPVVPFGTGNIGGHPVVLPSGARVVLRFNPDRAEKKPEPASSGPRPSPPPAWGVLAPHGAHAPNAVCVLCETSIQRFFDVIAGKCRFSLIKNIFPYDKNHFLLISREPFAQRLYPEAILAMALMVRALGSAFEGFFNGGSEAGAGLGHFHGHFFEHRTEIWENIRRGTVYPVFDSSRSGDAVRSGPLTGWRAPAVYFESEDPLALTRALAKSVRWLNFRNRSHNLSLVWEDGLWKAILFPRALPKKEIEGIPTAQFGAPHVAGSLYLPRVQALAQREDIGALLQEALSAVGDLRLPPFWAGPRGAVPVSLDPLLARLRAAAAPVVGGLKATTPPISDASPSAFLVLGRLDGATLSHFGRTYRSSYTGVPVVVAGGRGPDTLALLEEASRESGQSEQEYLEAVSRSAGHELTRDTVSTADVAREILRREGVPQGFLFVEGAPSRTLVTAFANGLSALPSLSPPAGTPGVLAVVTNPLAMDEVLAAGRPVLSRWAGGQNHAPGWNLTAHHNPDGVPGPVSPEDVGCLAGYPVDEMKSLGLFPKEADGFLERDGEYQRAVERDDDALSEGGKDEILQAQRALLDYYAGRGAVRWDADRNRLIPVTVSPWDRAASEKTARAAVDRLFGALDGAGMTSPDVLKDLLGLGPADRASVALGGWLAAVADRLTGNAVFRPAFEAAAAKKRTPFSHSPRSAFRRLYGAMARALSEEEASPVEPIEVLEYIVTEADVPDALRAAALVREANRSRPDHPMYLRLIPASPEALARLRRETVPDTSLYLGQTSAIDSSLSLAKNFEFWRKKTLGESDCRLTVTISEGVGIGGTDLLSRDSAYRKALQVALEFVPVRPAGLTNLLEVAVAVARNA